MNHWIYCWELGGGLGHLSRMKAISEGLQGQGDRIGWCVPKAFLDVARDHWPQVLAAPDSPRPRPSVVAPGSLAEILQNDGWNETDRVAGWVAQWQEVFKQVKANRILLDFAPNALLASVAGSIPVDVLGTGFYIPPDQNPLPPVRMDHGIYPDRLQWAEEQIVSTVNCHLPDTITGLNELFHHPLVCNHLLTYPQMDHYGVRGNTRYTGMVTGFSGEPVEWPDETEQRIFAYLKPFPHLHYLLQLIEQSGASMLVHGNAQLAGLVDQLGLKRVRYCPHPVDESTLGRANATMINHAGHDGTIKAIRAGLALWQLPLNIEQSMTARNARQLGVSDWLSVEQLVAYPAALERLFAEKEQRQKKGLEWSTTVPEPREAMQRVFSDLGKS